MVGRAFLQCILDEPVHIRLHETLGIPAGERNTMRSAAGEGPVKLYWLADINYDVFGHLHFFGLEVDLAALAAGAGEETQPGALSGAFAGALANALGAALAARLPKLEDWDCNTLQYVRALDEESARGLSAAVETRERWPAIIENGKHAGPALTLSLVREGSGEAKLVATCRRSKLNALLHIKGLGTRPLFRLMEPEVEQRVKSLTPRPPSPVSGRGGAITQGLRP